MIGLDGQFVVGWYFVLVVGLYDPLVVDLVQSFRISVDTGLQFRVYEYLYVMITVVLNQVPVVGTVLGVGSDVRTDRYTSMGSDDVSNVAYPSDIS